MKIKVGDVLKFVSDQPLSQYDWHIALIHHLNQSVPDDQHILATQTGKQAIAHLMLRGVEEAMTALNMIFDTDTGRLYPEDQLPPPVMVAPPPAVTVVPTQYQWDTQKVTIIAIGTLITVLVMFFTYQGRQSTPGQERVMETAIRVLGNLALDKQTESLPSTEPEGQIQITPPDRILPDIPRDP